MKLLSVIIPAYITNNETAENLALLINKLAGQINPERHEVLVIDDGSSFSLDWVKIAGSRCIVQKNMGVASARNTGIDNTTGEWITFLDADDMIPDDFIKIIEEQIDKESDIEADILQFQAKHQDGNIAYPIPCAWGKVIRREWIGKDRFDKDQLIGEEDTLFLNKGSLTVYIPKVIYHHQQDKNPDSLMKRFWRGELPRRRGTDEFAKV